MKEHLIVDREYNTLAYYYGTCDGHRVLLTRLLIWKRHPNEHVIEVIAALRRIEGEDPRYPAALAAWNQRWYWYNNGGAL